MLLNINTRYYPFGSPMSSRSFNATSYKYGFNGKEKDDENTVNGGSYDFGARILDTRLGRWLACDPKSIKYPSLSPFVAFGNDPNYYIDPGGETLRVAGSTEENVAVGKNDLISLLPPGQAGKDFGAKLTFENDGSVKFNITKEQAVANGDPGVMLLYNTVKSENTYQYSVEKTIDVKITSTGEILKKEGLANVPTEPKYAEGALLVNKSPAVANVDAVLNIPATYKLYNVDGSIESRPSIVFHELQESYNVQDEKTLYFSKTAETVKAKPQLTGPAEKYPDVGAHDKSINIAKENFKPEDPRCDDDPGKGVKFEQ